MVSSIVPGAAGAGALGVDTRLARPQAHAQAERQDKALNDRVDVSGPAAWSAARESVRAGLAEVHQALAIGHEAQSMLVQVQALARQDGASQADLDALLRSYMDRVDAALADGASLISGQSLSVQAEPGGAPVAIAGADLRLGQEAAEGAVLKFAAGASLAEAPALAQAAQRSLDALQGAMERLFEAARSLEAHQGFLGAAEGMGQAANVDLNAESARLLALQVRQGLQSVGSAAIANVEPQAVISLFKA